MTDDQPLLGNPVRRGKLWYMVSEEVAELVSCALYSNGIYWTYGENEVSISLSPFCLVRTCRFPASCSNKTLTDLKIFKLNLFTQDLCFFFGIQEDAKEDPETLREDWVRDIAKVVQVLTQSLYTPYSITCEPLATVATTSRRLMAGYLLVHESDSTVTLLYCELHPHCSAVRDAQLAFYENEDCQSLVTGIRVTPQTKCAEKAGVGCTCFSVDGRDFSARSPTERRLWLRAISNIKVKLVHEAPAPDGSELATYRRAIQEYITSVEAALECGVGPARPLLHRLPWRPAVFMDTHSLQERLEAPGPDPPPAVPNADSVASICKTCRTPSRTNLQGGLPNLCAEVQTTATNRVPVADLRATMAALVHLMNCTNDDISCERDCRKSSGFDMSCGGGGWPETAGFSDQGLQQAAQELRRAREALEEDRVQRAEVLRHLGDLLSQVQPGEEERPVPKQVSKERQPLAKGKDPMVSPLTQVVAEKEPQPEPEAGHRTPRDDTLQAISAISPLSSIESSPQSLSSSGWEL